MKVSRNDYSQLNGKIKITFQTTNQYFSLFHFRVPHWRYSILRPDPEVCPESEPVDDADADDDNDDDDDDDDDDDGDDDNHGQP